MLNNGGWSHEIFEVNYWAGYVAATYQSAVMNADVITLGLGNANFDSFLKERLMPLVGMGTDEEFQEELANYSYMTLENALVLCEDLCGNAKELVTEVYGRVMSKLSSAGLPTGRVNLICGRVAYVVASYIASYEELIDVIVEINPDVEIVLVPMVSNVTDFEVDLVYNGTTVNFNAGEVLGVLYYALNAYIAGIPVANQLENKINLIFEDEFDVIINAILDFELSDNGLVDNLKADIKAELDAIVGSLEAIKAAVGINSVSEIPALVVNLIELNNDIRASVRNIRDLCKQAGVDANQLVILPTIDNAISLVEDVIVPEILGWGEDVATKYKDARIYYADLSLNVNIELDSSSDLDIYDDRLINAVQSTIFPLIFGSMAEGLEFTSLFDSEDVKEFQNYKELFEAKLAEEGYKNAYSEFMADMEALEELATELEDALTALEDAQNDPNATLQEIEAIDKEIEEIGEALEAATTKFGESKEALKVAVGDKLDYFIESIEDDGSFKLDINGTVELTKIHMIAFYVGIAEIVIEAMNHTPVFNVNDILSSVMGGGDLSSIIGELNFDPSDLVGNDFAENIEEITEIAVLLWVVSEESTGSDTEFEVDAEFQKNAASLIIALDGASAIGDKLSDNDLLKNGLYVYGKLICVDDMFSLPTEKGHKLLANSIIKAYSTKSTVQDETIENITKLLGIAGALIGEFYDEAYEYAYNYADEHQYTTKAVNVIDRVINRLERVDLSDNTMTAAFREDLQVEIDALITTLTEIRCVIENDDAKDVEGLVATLYALDDDVLTHVNNINALCEQFGIDLNNKVILPLLDEAFEIINTELIPAVEAFVDAFVEAFVAYVTEKAEELYVVVYGIAEELYLELVAFATKVALYVGPKAEMIYRQFTELLEILAKVRDDLDAAIGEALEFFNDLMEKVIEIKGNIDETLEEIIDRVYKFIDCAKELYDRVVDVLVEVFGNVENAILVAQKVCERLLKLAEQYKNDLAAFALEAYAVYEDIVDLIVKTYGETKDAIYTAKQVYLTVISTLCGWNEELQDMIEGATSGSYELTEDSYYVALGNSQYAQELADMLNLGSKFDQFTVDQDFAEAVAGADLITIKVNNGEFYSFAYTQIMGTLADIVRSNDHLVGWLNNSLVGDDIRAVIESYGIDLEAQAEELEWSKYISTEDKELLDMFLARVKAKLLEMGIPETFELDVTAEIEEVLRAEGLLLPGVEVAIEPVVIEVADLAVYAIENLLYSYAQFVERTAVLLGKVRELSPEAVVVITHVANPLELMPFDISGLVPEFDKYSKVLDKAIDALNLYLYGLAVFNENTIFVDSEEAEDIYDALNVFCEHKYDDCEDTICNICGETRVAPGHSYTQWIYNNDHTCTEDGTVTAKCDNCDSVTTVTKKGSATGHNWKEATCTTPKTCLNCGEVSGKAAGHLYDHSCDTDCNRCGNVRSITHTFGEWEITVHPTIFKAGEQSRTCSVCGYTETKPYEIEPETDFATIVALALGSIIVAFGASTAIILLIQKKKEK